MKQTLQKLSITRTFFIGFIIIYMIPKHVLINDSNANFLPHLVIPNSDFAQTPTLIYVMTMNININILLNKK